MKRRIERSIEQRTAMLNGVSHDLRTILTRFKLSLALMENEPETADMQKDVDEMQRMLEAYLAFARGDAGERRRRSTSRSVGKLAQRCRAQRLHAQRLPLRAIRSSPCGPMPSSAASSISSPMRRTTPIRSISKRSATSAS